MSFALMRQKATMVEQAFINKKYSYAKRNDLNTRLD